MHLIQELHIMEDRLRQFELYLSEFVRFDQQMLQVFALGLLSDFTHTELAAMVKIDYILSLGGYLS